MVKLYNFVISYYTKRVIVIMCNVGGGFRMGDSLMYMESFTHIIEHLRTTRGLNVRIFSVDYGKMLDANYSRSKEDCMNGYRYLVQDLKIDPKKIVLGMYLHILIVHMGLIIVRITT